MAGLIILGLLGLVGLILCSVGGAGILPWIGAVWLGYLVFKRPDFFWTKIFILYIIAIFIFGIFSVAG